MTEKIVITPFEEKNYPEVREIFHQGYGSKFSHFITPIKPDLYDDLAMVHRTPYRGSFVALKENKISGFLWLIYKGMKKGDSQRISLGKLIQKYGINGLIRFIIFDILFHHKPETGEVYIDTIGVSSDFRGKGIGTALLQFTDRWAKKEGFTHLTLYVIEGNKGAKKLYEREGFKTLFYKRSRLMKWVSHIEGVYFMRKDLSDRLATPQNQDWQ